MSSQPRSLGIGVGAHGFDRNRLVAYCRAVVDPGTGAALVKTVRSVERKGYEVKGEHYKTLPRGFEPSSPDQERLLRYAALWIGEDEKLPADLHTPPIDRRRATEWNKMAPLHRWLVDALQ